MFWDFAAAERLLHCHYPWFLPTWTNYSSVVTKGDAIRPFILHAYGGVYLDFDVECYNQMDATLSGGVDLVLNAERDDMVVNAEMASMAGHPFWLEMASWLMQAALVGITSPLKLTGPELLTAAMMSYYAISAPPLRGQYTHGNSTLRIHAQGSWFTPCNWNDVDCQAALARSLRHKSAAGSAVVGNHHYSGSWLGTDGSKSLWLRRLGEMEVPGHFSNASRFVEARCRSARLLGSEKHHALQYQICWEAVQADLASDECRVLSIRELHGAKSPGGNSTASDEMFVFEAQLADAGCNVTLVTNGVAPSDNMITHARGRLVVHTAQLRAARDPFAQVPAFTLPALLNELGLDRLTILQVQCGECVWQALAQLYLQDSRLLSDVALLAMDADTGELAWGARPLTRAPVRAMSEGGINHVLFLSRPRVRQGGPRGGLHLWVRCLCGGSDGAGALTDPQVRGFYFVESIRAAEETEGGILLQALNYELWGGDWVVELPNGTEVVAQHEAPAFGRAAPGSILATLPGRYSTAHDLKLRQSSSSHYALLSLTDCQDSYRVDVSLPPRGIQVRKMPYTLDMARVAPLVWASIEYHTTLGFDRLELFATRAQVRSLLSTPQARALVRDGRLAFVTTNEMTHFEGLILAWQTVYYSHALLSYWGQPVRLLLTDLDEWLVLPHTTTSVQALLAALDDPPVVCFGIANLFSLGLQHAQAEAEAWTKDPFDAFLTYNLSYHDPNKLAKCIADPQRTQQAFVHGVAGIGGEGTASEPNVNASIAYVAEVSNILAHRGGGWWARATPEQSWRWIIDATLKRVAAVPTAIPVTGDG